MSSKDQERASGYEAWTRPDDDDTPSSKGKQSSGYEMWTRPDDGDNDAPGKKSSKSEQSSGYEAWTKPDDDPAVPAKSKTTVYEPVSKQQQQSRQSKVYEPVVQQTSQPAAIELKREASGKGYKLRTANEATLPAE
eukprot:m.73739 g.73739  ORF g.73739 m.73739 type:complete len:136 (-) comp17054_c0_seq2:95-502(-)